MRPLLILLSIVVLSTQWVIYRKNNPKRKIICKPETEWDNSTSATDGDELQHGDLFQVSLGREKRDVEVDPERMEPIIFLGQKSNVSSVFVDDGDFDIVSDYLTKDEIRTVKQQIMNTCNYLDRQRKHKDEVKTGTNKTQTHN